MTVCQDPLAISFHSRYSDFLDLEIYRELSC